MRILWVSAFCIPLSIWAADPWSVYQSRYAGQVPGLLTELIRFPTHEGVTQAHEDQKAWLKATAERMNLTFRDTGKVFEIELAGPSGAPVIGLIIHGDVVKADPSEWSHPPFEGIVKDGIVYGRGSADDKGPLIQALAAMQSLRDSGLPRTHTIRILVGTEEESAGEDVSDYLKNNQPPAFSLVLDSAFPVVVGEKAWNAMEVLVAQPYQSRTKKPGALRVLELDAGLATSIVPSRAVAKIEGPIPALLQNVKAPPGYGWKIEPANGHFQVIVTGRAAHAGMNLAGGRNALVLLARTLVPHLEPSSAADLLAFAAQAGKDTKGTGLGLTKEDPLWGHADVNVATIKPTDNGGLRLMINVRTIPGAEKEQLRTQLAGVVNAFNERTGSQLTMGPGSFTDTTLAFDPESKLVRRLLADYRKATGTNERPAISGGGTYAKRFPRAIAFGMWFPGKPYPGHDTNEQISIADLNRGVKVLLTALQDLACGPPLQDPFSR